MDLKELAKALGLPEAATEEEIKNAVSAAAKAAEKLKEMEGNTSREGEKAPEEAEVVANSTILSMLGLKAGARTEDVAASIMAELRVAGCIQRYCDNRTGADGGQTVSVKRGTFVWNNDGTIKETDILKACYVKDEQTVTITPDGSYAAGIILEVAEDSVTVDMMQTLSTGN